MSYCLFRSNAESKATPTRGEIVTFYVLIGYGSAVHAVHADVLPLDRQRALVTDIIERHDDVFEIDIAVADRTKIQVTGEKCYGSSHFMNGFCFTSRQKGRRR